MENEPPKITKSSQITPISEDEIIAKYVKSFGYTEKFIRTKLAEQPKVENPKFLEAIRQSTITEIPTEFDESAVVAARKQLHDTGFFLMGETHGVSENPDIYYTLMKQLGCRGLALEWDEASSPQIERYLQTEELDFDQALGISRDGRVTVGHFALLQRLKHEGMLDKLILFDPIPTPGAYEAGKGAETRDEGMATNLITYLDRTIPTLVIAGSIHTNIEKTDKDGDMAAKTPMGAHLKAHFPSINAGRIHYRKGSFYNMEERHFEPGNDIEPKPTFTLDTNGNFIYNLPKAHVAIVPGQ